MPLNQVSRTALTAAAARAAHLLVDAAPYLFEDPLAAVLLGDQAEELLSYHRRYGDHPILAAARVAVTARSACAEAVLRRAVQDGVRQYVVLAAGLDSYAHRADPAVTVFEVDHPATQDWKREQSARAGLLMPGGLRLVPLDLEADDLAVRLVEHGFDPARPAVVSWLGATMYLTADAITGTLRRVAGWAAGTVLVLDHILPERLRDEVGQQYAEQVGAAAAEQGEPWLTALAPDELTAMLRTAGFGPVRHRSLQEAVPAERWERADGLRPHRLSQLAVATVGDPAV